METKKVLFVCEHNSGRSQMAQAFMNHLSGGRYTAESAGLEQQPLNPFVVKAMAEVGIDISNNTTDLVIDYFREGRMYYYVFKVCDQTSAERCPIFPDILDTVQWDVKDPAKLKGTDAVILAGVREIRDTIKSRVEEWLAAH
ncbi:MAG: arsenate reductase ArsC [Deferribacterales bacterium]|jgi:arsenate reductase